jgi:hypothetical protein
VQLSANLTEKTSVRPVAPKIASMSGGCASTFTGSSGDDTIIISNGNDTITGGVGARRGLRNSCRRHPPSISSFSQWKTSSTGIRNVTHLMIPSRAPGYSHLAARL